jgi:hypothetical protein
VHWNWCWRRHSTLRRAAAAARTFYGCLILINQVFRRTREKVGLTIPVSFGQRIQAGFLATDRAVEHSSKLLPNYWVRDGRPQVARSTRMLSHEMPADSSQQRRIRYNPVGDTVQQFPYQSVSNGFSRAVRLDWNNKLKLKVDYPVAQRHHSLCLDQK